MSLCVGEGDGGGSPRWLVGTKDTLIILDVHFFFISKLGFLQELNARQLFCRLATGIFQHILKEIITGLFLAPPFTPSRVGHQPLPQGFSLGNWNVGGE